MKTATLLPKPIRNALGNRSLFTEALFTRPESLSSLLPYEEYATEHGVYCMRDGSLGAVFQVDLLEHEPMTEKEITGTVKSVKPWFNLPENCTMQVIYEQSAISEFDAQLNEITESYPDAHPVSQHLFDQRSCFLRDACKKQTPNTPMRRSTYLAVRYFPKDQNRSITNHFRKEGAVLHKEMTSFVKELRSFQHLIADLKSNSSVVLKPVGPSNLLDILRRFFNPRTYYKRSFASYNPHASLSDQFIYTAPTLNHQGIEREGVKTRTLSLKTSPQWAYPGGMAYFTKLNFPFKIALNFSFPEKSKVKRFFDLKEFFLQNTPTAKAKVQREEILETQDKLARDDRCLYLTFNVIIEGESDEILEDRTRAICNVFHNNLECEVIAETDIGLGLCLNSLPLCYAQDSDLSSQRYIRILRSDAVNFLPIFDSFRGLKDPLSVYLSRENNLVPFSLLENETSNHTVVLADSGSGKSAFVIDCIIAAKRMKPEPLVFIIDKKSSYAMLAEYYDGDLTIFDRNQDIPFSPFRGVYDEEKIAFLTKLIISAIKLTSPSFEIESEHQAAISSALKRAYVKKCERQGLAYVEGELRKEDSDQDVELTMEDFVTELAATQDDRDCAREMVNGMLQKLKPFYADGIYAKFFWGTSKEDGKSKLFYVYDLDALDSDPILQTLMTMAVIEEIRRIIALPENQGRTGFIVMEEFAILGRNNPMFRDFALDFAETMRKRGVWLITLTPRPQNYFDLEVGKAFWSVADNYIFLQMSSDNVDYLATKSSLIDEANKEIIRSLRTKRNEYAEIFFLNKKKTRQGAFRNHQTSSARWMAPTNAKDSKVAMEALQRFGNKWEALRYLEDLGV
ncbi:MAG: TraC family protein [Oligoflexales bacterium]